MCHLCGVRGNLVTLKRHFGDEVKDAQPDTASQHTAILGMAAKYYASVNDSVATSYLQVERGLTPETIAKHQLGFAPGGRALLQHLRPHFKPQDIVDTGLVVERGKRYQDFLQEQITIPYHLNGMVVAIRGKEIGGKYVTPPGTKARLFNVDAATRAEEVVLTEGEFDALILEQLGFAALGVPGANTFQPRWADYFTEARRVYVLFDPDSAGKTGTERVTEALGAKAKPIDVPVPDDVDPKDADPSYFVVQQNWAKSDFEDLFRQAARAGSILVSVRDAFDEWEGLQTSSGLKLGFPLLDMALAPGLMPGQVMVPLAKTNSGKCVGIHQLIPTPDGFRRMGDVQAGDQVFGLDGLPTRVTGVFPQGRLWLYRVSFSDGSHLDTTLDHIWEVQYRYGRSREWRTETMTTKDIMDSGLRGNGREWRYQIPMTEPVQYPARTYPIDPYTLGALIANGTLGSGGIQLTTPDGEVVERIRLSHQCNSHRSPPGACPRFGLPGLTFYIRDLGLDVHSLEKFIPNGYLLGSVSQRIALLQGLMDGDGSAYKKTPNAVLYHTGSPQLAENVAELVASLGGTGTVKHVQRHDGKPDEYLVSIMLPEGVSPFSTSRKAAVVKPGARYNRVPRRAIVSVDRVGGEPCVCISVDHPRGLFLAGRRYVVTHNTLLLLSFMHRAAMAHPTPLRVLFVSLEQTRSEWFERARRIWFFYNPCDPAKNAQAWEQVGEFGRVALHQWIDEGTRAFWQDKLYIVDRNRVTEEQLHGALEEFKEATGSVPDLMTVDYLGYLAMGSPGNSKYEKTSNAIMSLKAVAKEWRVPIISPHQVSRGAEFGTEFQIDQGRDAGTVEETADFVLTLWNQDDSKGNKAQRKGELAIHIGKSRHGGKGTQLSLQMGTLSLAIVPKEDTLYEQRAAKEAEWSRFGLPWDEAIYHHHLGVRPVAKLPDPGASGSLSIPLSF